MVKIVINVLHFVYICSSNIRMYIYVFIVLATDDLMHCVTS